MQLVPVEPGSDNYIAEYVDSYSQGTVPSDGRMYWRATSADGTAIGNGLGPTEAISWLVVALEKQVADLKIANADFEAYIKTYPGPKRA